MFRLLVLGVILLTALFPVSAQEDLEDLDFAEMSLEDLLNVEVTVASKTEETAADAPSTVTVFSRAEIQNLGITTVHELLNYVPGFQATRDSTNGIENAIAARGSFSNNGNTVLFLMNGFRVNEQYQGAHIGSRDFSIENIQRVEIIRGPGSALYGSNAFLGVVNIVTTNDVNDAKFQYGNLDSRDFAINMGRESGDLKASFFARAFSDSGETYSGVYDQLGLESTTDDPIAGFEGYLSLQYRNFTVNVRHSEREQDNYYFARRLASDINHHETSQSSIDLKLDFDFSSSVTADFTAGYSLSTWDGVVRIFPANVELGPPGLPFFTEGDFVGGPSLETAFYNLGFNMAAELSSSNTLNFGLAFEAAEAPDNLNINNYDTPPNSLPVFVGNEGLTGNSRFFLVDEDRTIGSFYVQDKQNFGSVATLILGVRYDDYSDFGESINPRGALIIDHGGNGKIKFLYGEAFRAPSLAELYTQNNPNIAGDASLDATTIQTFEIGIVQNFGSRAQVSLTGFRNDIENFIILGPAPEGGVPTFINGLPFTTEGLELEFLFQIGSGFLMRGGYQLITDGEDVFSPDTVASLILNWNYGGFNFNLNGVYRSEIQALPNQDAYLLANAKLRYQISKALGFFLVGKNFTDEEYFTAASGGLDDNPAVIQNSLPNRTSQWLLGLNYKY